MDGGASEEVDINEREEATALDENTCDNFLDALVEKDLPRFSSRIENVVLYDIEPWKAVGWFAYFTGPRFYDVWRRRGKQLEIHVNYMLCDIAAFTADRRMFFKYARLDNCGRSRELPFFAAAGGDVSILKFIFKSRDIRKYIDCLDAYPVTPRLVDLAKANGHPEAAQYLMKYAKEHLNDSYPTNYIYTKPQLRDGKYSCENIGTEPP